MLQSFVTCSISAARASWFSNVASTIAHVWNARLVGVVALLAALLADAMPDGFVRTRLVRDA
jgi:hypothetical protein